MQAVDFTNLGYGRLREISELRTLCVQAEIMKRVNSSIQFIAINGNERCGVTVQTGACDSHQLHTVQFCLLNVTYELRVPDCGSVWRRVDLYL